MATRSSTTSSLSSISEDSTYGVEGEDLPPSVPKRKRSVGSRSVSAATGTVISLHDVETLESIDEDEAHGIGSSSRSSSRGRKSHRSGRTDNQSRLEAEEKSREVDERSTTQRRRRRSSNSSSRSKHSARESSRSESDRAKNSTKNSPKRQTTNSPKRQTKSPKRQTNSPKRPTLIRPKRQTNSPKRPTLIRPTLIHHGRSRSTSDLQKDDQEANRTEVPFRSNSLRTLPSHTGIDTSDRSQEEKKAKEMTRKKSSRSSRRSCSTSSERDITTKDVDEVLLKQTRVVERRHRPRSSSSTGGHRRRHSHSSSRRSLSAPRHHPSDWSAISEADSGTQFSRNLDRRGAQHEFRRSTSSDGEDTASEASDDESRPGAYRVSSYSTNRLLAASSLASSTGDTFVGENVFVDGSDSSFSESNNSTLFSSSNITPASNGTLVTAEMARDRTDEIEAAREQGRVEGLVQASNHNNSVLAVVAQPSLGPKTNNRSWAFRTKRWLIRFGLCFCLILISVIIGYFVLIREPKNVLEGSSNQNDGGSTAHPEDNSGLDAVISFDPPSAEDCASIANGTDVAGQEEMFTQFVDMHVQITTESEEEKAFLVKLLKQQIQLNLIPRLVGCDDLEGNVIGNGVVDSHNNMTSTCLFQSNPLCLEVVLTVKIYLRRQEDGSTVLDIMSELLLDEDLNDSLELPPSVESVGIPVIAPSNFSTSVPTESPSWSPSVSNTGSKVESPSTMPNTVSPSVEPTSWKMPAINMGNPTIEPTLQPTPGSSPVPTSRPTLDFQLGIEPLLPIPSTVPSLLPTKSPSATPTVSPSTSPSASPSASPSLRPTGSPSALPSISPSLRPTVSPSATPTDAPSTPPTSTPSAPPTTSSPSNVPSFSPSTSPSVHPSESPTATFSPSGSPTTTPQPTVGGFFWVACGKLNGCNRTLATVQYTNHVTIDGIPSILDQDMIAVRCCSDTYIDRFHGPLEVSCPYARSKIGGTCYNTATYWEAENVCSDVGARLCTLEELENNCAKGSGCDHNRRMVWTSTPGSP